jgi:hypothetical protein
VVKKSVEVGDDNPISSWNKFKTQDDLAFLNRETSSRTFKQGPPTRMERVS